MRNPENVTPKVHLEVGSQKTNSLLDTPEVRLGEWRKCPWGKSVSPRGLSLRYAENGQRANPA